MIFTLRSNQARIERAEQRGRAAAQEAQEAARQEAEERLELAVQQADLDKQRVELAQQRVELAEQQADLAERQARQMAAEMAAHHRAWAGWNERRMAAEQAGQPFTEPPPAPPANRNGSGPENAE